MSPNQKYSTFDSPITEEEVSEAKDFDDILKIVGSHGRYQKLLLYAILTPFFFILPFFPSTVIFLLYEPPHHCHIPHASTSTAFTSPASAFWNLTLPRELGPDGLERFDQCSMFASPLNRTLIACPDGWDYDKTDYEDTIVSTYNWVCEQSEYATIAYTIEAIGSAIGTVIFGWISDRFGRKRCFLVCCLMMTVFLTLRLFVAMHFPLFLICTFLWSATYPMIYITVYAIAVELTDAESRAWVYGFTWIVWVMGMGLLALIAWLSRHWLILGLVTALPGFAIFVFYYFYIPESPRWLLQHNRIGETADLLLEVASVNGRGHRVTKGDLTQMLRQAKDRQDIQEPVKGTTSILSVFNLFSSWRMGFNTVMLSITWSANALLYYAITLLCTSIAGNQFLNYFLLAIIEMPSGYVAGVSSDRVGRRWTQTFFFLISCISLVVTSFAIRNPSHAYLVISSIMVCRFCQATTNLIISLQASEIFPTELRSTGSGLACSLAYAASIAAPSVAYLVKLDDMLPYITLFVICLIGTISSSFLPETLNQSLPETLEDAKALGEHASYWSFLPTDYKTKSSSNSKADDTKPLTSTCDSQTEDTEA